jgi:hypothetical protein
MMAVHVVRMRRKKDRILVGKTLGKCPLRRFRRRGEENIMMDLKKIGCKDGQVHVTGSR